jgi:Uma2 family endonuclease
MTQAVKYLTLEEYIALDAEDWVRLGLPEGRCEYVNGVLRELPPESEQNDRIALNLRDHLLEQVSNDWLVRIHSCELVVPKIRPTDPSTRFPDLVVLQEAHVPLIQRRLLIPLETVPPRLVAEVVSPGTKNEKRDYEDKREQYAARGIPEYWWMEPQHDRIRILELQGTGYVEVGSFSGSDRLISKAFPGLPLTAGKMLNFVTSRLQQEIERAEQAEQLAEQAEQRAEAEQRRAEQAEQRAEAEQQRAEQLTERLRQLGIEIDEFGI